MMASGRVINSHSGRCTVYLLACAASSLGCGAPGPSDAPPPQRTHDEVKVVVPSTTTPGRVPDGRRADPWKEFISSLPEPIGGNDGLPIGRHVPTYSERIKLARRYYRAGSFEEAVKVAREAHEQRFEEKGGAWVFRHDELNRLTALSAYRLGIECSKGYDKAAVRELRVEHEATFWFCLAITVDPNTVNAAQRRFPLTANAKAPFDKARQHCSMAGGFRTRIPGNDAVLAGPDESWWIGRTLFTQAERLERIEECYRIGDAGCVSMLWGEAPGPDRYERRGDQWCGRENELNRFYVRSEIRSASVQADSDGRWPADGFSVALRLSPALVDAVLKEHALSAKARAAFEQAKASDEYTGCSRLNQPPPAPDLFDTPVDADASTTTGGATRTRLAFAGRSHGAGKRRAGSRVSAFEGLAGLVPANSPGFTAGRQPG